MAEPAEAMFQRAVQAYRDGAYERARADCQELQRILPPHAGVLGLLGAVELRRQNPDAAIAALTQAATLAPADPGILSNLGSAYRLTGQSDRARQCLRQVISTQPDHVAARFNLALAEADCGDKDAALAQYRAILERDPRHVEAWHNRAVIESSLDQPGAALAAYGEVLRLAPDDPAATLGLARCHRLLGQADAALAAFDRAVGLAPDDAGAHAERANILAELERFEDAADAGACSLGRDPNAAPVWSNQGWILVQLGRLDDAIDACRKAIAIDPGFAPARYHLGLAQQAAGDLAASATALEAAIAANPRYVRALATLGLVRAAMGDAAATGRIFDHENMVGLHRIRTVPGYDGVEQFNRALIGHLKRHDSLMWNRPNRSTIDGSQTLDIAGDRANPVVALRAAIDEAVAGHVTAMTERDQSGFYRRPPAAWDLVIWGVILKAGGHQDPHNHPSGYLSGVYYLSVPDEVGQANGEAGFLEFGQSNVAGPDGRQLAAGRRRAVQPEAGLMALFPSYFWHRTLPFESLEERICVAFDVLAKEQ
jgi:tetratricopeptide (TPR) repeat protein